MDEVMDLPVLNLYFISLTTDNASVNDVVVSTASRCLLARYGIAFQPDCHIRCIAHIVNLVVQALLSTLEEADDPDILDYFEIHKGEAIHYNVDDDEDQAALEAEEIDEQDVAEDVEMDPEEEKMATGSALQRVRPCPELK
jgi:hypothetical protein